MTATQLPDEYVVLEQHDDGRLIVGMGFKHFNRPCEPSIIYNGELYNAGALTYIPKELAGHYCCAREYLPPHIPAPKLQNW